MSGARSAAAKSRIQVLMPASCPDSQSVGPAVSQSLSPSVRQSVSRSVSQSLELYFLFCIADILDSGSKNNVARFVCQIDLESKTRKKSQTL